MTSQTPREKAAQDAAALVAALRAVPQSPITTQLVELGEHLERAVRAFHMEAIRFRAFTMSRLIKQHAGELPDDVVGKSYQDLEQEWHAWLAAWADNSLPHGVNAESWWGVSDVVKQGFDRLYEDDTTVTQEQYALLATARVALNRGDIEIALALMLLLLLPLAIGLSRHPACDDPSAAIPAD